MGSLWFLHGFYTVSSLVSVYVARVMFEDKLDIEVPGDPIAMARKAETPLVSTGIQPSGCVGFASMPEILRALEKAGELAPPLGFGITVLSSQVAPRPLPLDRPSVCVGFIAGRLQKLASSSRERIGVFCYLCRDPMPALQRVVPRERRS